MAHWRKPWARSFNVSVAKMEATLAQFLYVA